jgi:prepilin peptidase CpaA
VNVPFLLAAACGLAACVTDLRNRTIPNWIPLAALASGLVWHGWSGGWKAAGLSMLGAVAGFCVFLVFYLLGGMGGGDVKLTAGFGALLQVGAVPMAVLWISLVGGLAAVGVSLWQWWRKGHPASSRSKKDQASIPYAPAIAAGVWITFWIRS